MNKFIFHQMLNTTLGFRECSQLIKIAKQTNCKITLLANNKEGTTDSILSLIQLNVHNSYIVFTVEGEKAIECVKLLHELFEEGWSASVNHMADASLR